MRTSALFLLCLGAVKARDQPANLTHLVRQTTASSVCVYNDAAFVLRWRLHNEDTGAESAWSNHYPVGQVKCISPPDAAAGASLAPKVDAFWGKEITVEDVMYDPANATQITYFCTGTTLNFHCKQGPSPPTAGNVTKAVGEFLLGFAEGLGKDVGFTDCLADINGTFHDIVTIVDLFENGINGHVVPTIEKAFKLLGDLFKEISVAIATCAKDAALFAAKIKAIGAALSGDVEAVIKVVVGDFVKIWHERSELTADCKTTATSWRAGDFKGSGKAVGDITGIILGELI